MCSPVAPDNKCLNGTEEVDNLTNEFALRLHKYSSGSEVSHTDLAPPPYTPTDVLQPPEYPGRSSGSDQDAEVDSRDTDEDPPKINPFSLWSGDEDVGQAAVIAINQQEMNVSLQQENWLSSDIFALQQDVEPEVPKRNTNPFYDVPLVDTDSVTEGRPSNIGPQTLYDVPPPNARTVHAVPPTNNGNPYDVLPRNTRNLNDVPSRNAGNPYDVPPKNTEQLYDVPPRNTEHPYDVPPRNTEHPYDVPPRNTEHPYDVPPRNTEHPYDVPPRNDGTVHDVAPKNTGTLYDTPPEDTWTFFQISSKGSEMYDRSLKSTWSAFGAPSRDANSFDYVPIKARPSYTAPYSSTGSLSYMHHITAESRHVYPHNTDPGKENASIKSVSAQDVVNLDNEEDNTMQITDSPVKSLNREGNGHPTCSPSLPTDLSISDDEESSPQKSVSDIKPQTSQSGFPHHLRHDPLSDIWDTLEDVDLLDISDKNDLSQGQKDIPKKSDKNKGALDMMSEALDMNFVKVKDQRKAVLC